MKTAITLMIVATFVYGGVKIDAAISNVKNHIEQQHQQLNAINQ